MFPTADNPITGQTLASSRPADTAELSPPLSQDDMIQNDHILQLDEAMDTGVGPIQSSNSVINPMQFGTAVSQDAEHKRVPGSAWNNRKARDDYARAMDVVVDRPFNLSRPFQACACLLRY